LSKSYLLGLDIGSSSSKGTLMDVTGNIISCYTTKHVIDQPNTGWAEQSPDIWWQECIEIIHHCLSNGKIDPKDIKGISVSGMVPNFCPLGKNGEAIRPAILYRDNRAFKECLDLNHDYDLNLNLQDILPKWYWLKMKEYFHYKDIHMILNTHSYIVYKLTNQYNIDCDTAHLFGQDIFDGSTFTWNDVLINKIGLDPKVLPPIYRPTDIVGTITEDASQLTGLATGTPVIAGNGDSFTSLVGSGVVDAYDAMIYLGTAATLISLSKDIKCLANGPAFNSGSIHFLANVLTGGELLRWFKDKIQISKENLTFDSLEEGARSIVPGSNGLIILPHLEGQRTPEYNPCASGMMLGLSTSHTGVHIFRALLESLGFALYDSIIDTQIIIKRLVITGGGAKNSLLRQIIADIFNLPVEYHPHSDATIGNAYFVGFALGIFEDFDILKHQWLKDSMITGPNPENVELYKQYFSIYREANHTTKSLYSVLKKCE
jgi:sugar (pentulose or hexulose) kinase